MDVRPADLERAMARTWPALQQERLGGWVLRASGGFTNRANAALTSGDPGMPVTAALSAAASWYAVRGLPLKLVRTGPVGFEVGGVGDEVSAAAIERGCRAHSGAHVMVAPTAQVLAACEDLAAAPIDAGSLDAGTVRTATALPQAWLTTYGRSRSLVPGATQGVLTGSPEQVFAWLADDDGEVWAIARLGIADGWAGLAAVWVDPDRRRAGAGRRLTGALVSAAAQRGLDRLHLQVEVDNTAALTLYTALGFERHHDYVYLSAPSETQGQLAPAQ